MPILHRRPFPGPHAAAVAFPRGNGVFFLVLVAIGIGTFAASRREADPQATLSPSRAMALGALQGITEFLPLSSGAHLLLAEQSMAPTDPARIRSWQAYNGLLELASIGAVLAVCRRRIWGMARGLLGYYRDGVRPLLLLLVAFLPTLAGGLILTILGGENSRFHSPTFLRWPLLSGGIYILAFETARNGRGTRALEELAIREALLIGIFQAFALIPGVSRSLMTITAALALGLSAAAALEFSFLLGLGTIFSAALFQWWRNGPAFPVALPPTSLGIGCASSFLCALVSIPLCLRCLTCHSLRPFGYYRILLGIALFVPWGKFF